MGRTGTTTPVAIPGRRPVRAGVTGSDSEIPAAPRQYPGWTDPPTSGGPVPATPGGSVTQGAGGSVTASVTTGCRIPILYGKVSLYPDIVRAHSPSQYQRAFDCVISEGPIEEIEYPHLATGWEVEWIYAFSSWLGDRVTPPTGYLRAAIGVSCFTLTVLYDDPWTPRVVAKGRILYDPRLGAWGTGEYPDAAKCAYSTNPALVMADLLTYPQYGLGVDPDDVDWDSVGSAANWCDDIVDGAKRYELNLYVQAAGTADDWIQTVGLHAGLRWRQNGALWQLDYRATDVTPSVVISEDYIVNGSRPTVTYGAGDGLSGLPNRFTAEYVYYGTSGGHLMPGEIRTTTVSMPEVDAGAAIRDAATYRLHGFQTEVMAKRALQRIADEIYSEVELDLTLTLDLLDLTVGSVFRGEFPSLGLIGVNWIVTRLTYDAETIRVTANLYGSTTWPAPAAGEMDAPFPFGYSDPTVGALPSPPAPSPSAAPTPPTIIAPPAQPLLALYRSTVVDTPADGEVLVWDGATGTVRFEAGAPGGGGGAPTFAVEEFVATASQTDFVLAAAPITGGLIFVTRDGVLAKASDYTLTDDTVAFDTGLAEDTDVQIGYWSTAEEGTFALGEAFVATAGQTEFTLAHTPTTVILVSLNGVIQKTSTWDVVNGVTLTFGTGLVADDDVWISYLY